MTEAPTKPTIETPEQASLAALNDAMPVLEQSKPQHSGGSGPDSVDPALPTDLPQAQPDLIAAELAKTLNQQANQAEAKATQEFYQQARDERAEVIKDLFNVDEVVEGFAELAGMFAPEGKEEKAASLIRSKKTRALLRLIAFDQACEYYAQKLGGMGQLSPAVAGVAGLAILGGATAIGVRMAHVELEQDARGQSTGFITDPRRIVGSSVGELDLDNLTQEQWFALSDEERTWLQSQGLGPKEGK